jgi:hypothetical protein
MVVLAVVVAAAVGVGFAVSAADGDDGSRTVVADGGSTATSTRDAATTVPTSVATTTVSAPAPTSEPVAGGSWVGVGLQAAPAFSDGFDYGVRVLQGERGVVERLLAGFSSDGSGTYFTSLTVDPGSFVLASDLNVGSGGPPAPIDFSDACRTPVEVPEGGGVLVEVNWDTGCLVPLPTSSLPTLSSSPTMLTEALDGPAGTDPAPLEPAGSFDGMEEFALFTGRCNFLDHKLDATYSLSTGAKWRFHSSYCGEIDASNRHYGDGEFTFTTANGSTLEGTFHSDAQLPSKGEPYTMQIRQGTGDYTGASGECAIDNHLEMIRFGRQRQYGTFHCTVQRPSR